MSRRLDVDAERAMRFAQSQVFSKYMAKEQYFAL